MKALKSLTSITYNTASTSMVGVAGASEVTILRLDFLVGGAGGTLNLNSIEVNSLNTSDADISNVKLYRTTTTTFSTTNQLGTTQTFSSGVVTFSSLTYNLPSGTTYVWVTYTISSSATLGNTIDAKIITNKINVAGSTYPATDQSPSGSRTISGSPGGIYSNLSLWLEPGRGLTLSGSDITSWDDQSGNANTFTGGATKPTYVANGMCYNEITRWASGVSTMTATPNSLSDWTFYFILNTATGLTIADASFVVKYDQWPSTGKYGYTRKLIADYTSTISSNFSKADLLRFDHTTSNSNVNIYSQVDGVLASDNLNCGTTTLDGPIYELHCDNGDFCEFIGYNTQITSSTSQTQIESYLSLKYGITLQRSRVSSTYLNSNGSTIFSDAGTYWNDIIGIARDDYSVLLKKQSKTQDDSNRVYIGTLAASNSANTSVAADFGGDRASIVIGNNGGYSYTMNSTAAEKPSGINYRINREFKVTNTGFTGSYSFQVVLDSKASPASVTDSHLRLLVDDDGDFSNATIYASGASGITISYSNPTITVSGISTSIQSANTTKYFTIGSASSTTLPIELKNFDAVCRNEAIYLNWVTASETQNDYFVVERSGDGLVFDALGYVKGAGNSYSDRHYNWEDLSAFGKSMIYRIKQVDIDGNYTYSGNIQPAYCYDEDVVSVYPNPFLHDVYMEINNINISPFEFKIFDGFGNVVYDYLHHSPDDPPLRLKVVLSHLPSGFYIMELETNKHKKQFYKLIKVEN